MKVRNKVKSDHYPVVVYIKSNRQLKKYDKGEEGKSKKRVTKKEKKHLADSMRQKLKRRTRMKEKWEEIKNKINKTLEEVEREKKKEGKGGGIRRLEKYEKGEEKVKK